MIYKKVYYLYTSTPLPLNLEGIKVHFLFISEITT